MPTKTTEVVCQRCEGVGTVFSTRRTASFFYWLTLGGIAVVGLIVGAATYPPLSIVVAIVVIYKLGKHSTVSAEVTRRSCLACNESGKITLRETIE